MLPLADVVSLHLPLTNKTKHLFDAQRFKQMKLGALFVNTSRGQIVDEDALRTMLESGLLGGAYLDVFALEPLPPENPLWSIPNIIITPHAASWTHGWDLKAANFFLENFENWKFGRNMNNVVFPIK